TNANGTYSVKDPEVSYMSLYKIFKKIDVDKDSYITKDDIKKCLKNLKIKNITDDDVTIFLKYIDTQRKGYIDVNDFLTQYQLEDKSMNNWIKNTNKPYFDFIKNLKDEQQQRQTINNNLKQKNKQRSSSTNVIHNKNVELAEQYNDVIKNYNIQLDPFCPSYVIRERIRKNFIANKDDFLNKHKNATRFNLNTYKNTNYLTQPVENSHLYMNDDLRFKTTYNLNYQ
ncbi:calcium-binding protein, putative, partial [Hepatocystis sp. ex Piliocolobus tephrosceles]